MMMCHEETSFFSRQSRIVSSRHVVSSSLSTHRIKASIVDRRRIAPVAARIVVVRIVRRPKSVVRRRLARRRGRRRVFSLVYVI